MAGETQGPNGHAPTPDAIASVTVTEFVDGSVRVQGTPGLSLDRAERLCFGAMKFFERELQALRMQRALIEQPKVELVRGGLPRRPPIV